MVSVPELIFSLSGLQKVDLSHNNIQQGELFSLSVTSLDLSHNLLSTLTPKITALVALRVRQHLNCK